MKMFRHLQEKRFDFSIGFIWLMFLLYPTFLQSMPSTVVITSALYVLFKKNNYHQYPAIA